MKVSLFVPCYMNLAYPNAALSAYKLLTQLGLNVSYLSKQTCCGQMHANSGMKEDSKKIITKFINDYSKEEPDYIVILSGGCTSMVRDTYPYYLENEPEKLEKFNKLKSKTFEFCEFLVDVLKIKELPHKVSFNEELSIHYNCHYLRHIEPSLCSEYTAKTTNKSKIYQLLKLIDGVKIKELYSNPDECCGFGGTFSLKEEAISNQAGLERLTNHLDEGSKNIVFTDVSCKMHLDGLKDRQNININTYYIAELLIKG